MVPRTMDHTSKKMVPMHSVPSRVPMDLLGPMTVLTQIPSQVYLRAHTTHLLCQQRGIHLDISSHSVLEVMHRSLLGVVDSTGIRQDDSIPTTHPIRHQLHGRESSLYQPITRSISISIRDSTHNSRLSQVVVRSVSVPHSQIVIS